MQAYDYLKTKDWEKFFTVSNKYIESCLGVVDSESFSEAYRDRARAFFYTDQLDRALDSVNSCISIDRENPECYFDKTMILIKLDRFKEARKSLTVSERVTIHELLGIDSYIIASRNDKMKEYYIKRKSQLLRLLESINAYNKYFSH